jgi:hypothetical protein
VSIIFVLVEIRFIFFGVILVLRAQYAMYYDARGSDFLGLQVVPSYEYGELVLKNYKENLSQTRPTVFIPGGSPDISEVFLSKDVVFSEV